ncbi:MAG: Uma2 family endonuclease [Cyanobacteria bacterium P01_C01_bin.120]
MSVSPVDTSQPELEQANPHDGVFPPSDLYSDEPPLETDLHRDQIDLLIRILKQVWADRQDFYASGNLTIYDSPEQQKSKDFRGPDFFVVLGTERKPRKSWVVWEEGGRYPNVIVELLSESTAKTDRGLKKQIYQDIFRTPNYFWFDPDSLEFEGFQLMNSTYEPLPTNEQGWRWSEQLELYLGVHNQQLRFFTPTGDLVLSPEEQAAAERLRADTEQQRADAEQQRADAEQQRKEALAAKLRELGIDPDQL